MTGADLVLQFLGTAINPAVLAAALFSTLWLSRAWQIRLGTSVLAGVLGAVEGAVLDAALSAPAYAAVSAAAGLLVAEIVLHIVPSAIISIIRLGAAAQAWLRRRDP